MTKSNKGITLIALVITIIVLLILAGVSIAMLTGSNGVLTKATESQVMNKRGEVSERINLALNAVMTEIMAESITSSNGQVDLSNEKYSETNIEKENDLKANEYGVKVKTDELPSSKGHVVIINWNPIEFDASGKYGGEASKEKDMIWGAIDYDKSKIASGTTSTTKGVPFTIEKFANASMGQTVEKLAGEV